MEPNSQELMARYAPFARMVAAGFYRNHRMLDWEELLSTAFEAMCAAVARWPSYCESKGYEPTREEFLKVYLSRRVNGELLDLCRRLDVVDRKDRTTIKEAAGRGERIDPSSLSSYRSAVELNEASDYSTSHAEEFEVRDLASRVLSALAESFDELPAMERAIIASRYLVGLRRAEISRLLRAEKFSSSEVLARMGSFVRERAVKLLESA